MKFALKLLTVVGFILMPFILSAVFISVGKPDENGRYSLTGVTAVIPDDVRSITCQLQREQAAAVSERLGVDVPQDAGSGCQPTDLAQMGSVAYYKVNVSTPAAFYNAVNGKGFNEGYGLQCVAGFKEFMFALSGKVVATNTGGASGYAAQQRQIEPLGFKWHAGSAGLKDGDWGIFGGGQYGHVAMYFRGQWFGQNQGAADALRGNAFNLMSISTSNLIGYYRPNIYNKVSVSKPSTSAKPSPAPVIKQSDSSYTVRRGDTLGQVLIDQGWVTGRGLWGADGDAARSATANGIADPNLIFPGQVVRP